MLISSDIPPALRSHHQFPLATCAVSAFECVAILHGLLEQDKFPLQCDPTNREKGFGDIDFLESLGLSCANNLYDTQSAMVLIEKETAEGRFPLVSLRAFAVDGTPLSYHILICVLHNAKLLLVDPAKPSVVVDNKVDLANLLKRNRQDNPERKTLHILHYQMKNP